jgi:carbon-monoxide dehydrogenase large subunit
MPGSILGTRVPRLEDPDLLTGAARYVADLRPAGLLHARFVRSSEAHGRVRAVKSAAAAAMPGVVAVWGAKDLGLAPFHGFMVLNEACARPPLADDKVRFVGEPLAVVLAESEQAAADAVEAVEVDIQPLPAVVDPETALDPAAPLQFEELGTNLAAGFRDDGQDPLAGAHHVTRLRLLNQRLAAVPMEGHAILAAPGEPGGPFDLVVDVSTQMPHGFQARAARALGMAPERLRVRCPAVGGAFGGKPGVVAEHLVVMAAARRLGRPVRWVETRGENLLSMHGRGQVDYVELGFDDQARLVGARIQAVGDAGAYAGFGGALALGPTRLMAQGVYRLPALAYSAAAVLTNTTPVGAFRGAGRPEACELLERTMDLAATELGLDPVELRRRNLLTPQELPCRTLTGASYDSGDYPGVLARALELAGYEALRAEQAERRARGDHLALGIGVSVYVEVTAGGAGSELGGVRVGPDGRVQVTVGTSAHGQGHATAFAMVVADRLGVPLEAIEVVQSDTALVPRGGGTGGSRSLQVGGSAVAAACEEVLGRARELAAAALEAAPEDLVVSEDGQLTVAGVPSRGVSWAELAARAEEDGMPLAAQVDLVQDEPTFPFGAHVAVVEVDLETGAVRPLRHVAVDDCGQVVNPLLVEGQQHGGAAQGIAQALYEEVVYDSNGQPRTTGLADYAMPSAAELPSLEVSGTVTPTPRNPLGAKGIGESATVGATPAVHNAVVDALAHLGVRHLDMPCTPERVWRAIQAARAGTLPPLWQDPPAALASLPPRSRAGRPEAADTDI